MSLVCFEMTARVNAEVHSTLSRSSTSRTRSSGFTMRKPSRAAASSGFNPLYHGGAACKWEFQSAQVLGAAVHRLAHYELFVHQGLHRPFRQRGLFLTASPSSHLLSKALALLPGACESKRRSSQLPYSPSTGSSSRKCRVW